MENTAIKLTLSVVGGILLTFWEAYGAIIVLVCVAIVMDIITGLVGSAANGEAISSKVARKGFWRKMAELLALGFGIYLDYFLPHIIGMINVNLEFKSPLGLIVGCYIILNELISITENLAKARPDIVPSWILKLLQKSKQEIDKKEDNEDERKS